MGHNIFNQIEETIPGMDGWCPVDKAFTLASLCLGLRPKIVVEIGVWAGRSLIPMALACKQNGFGKVYAVDPWSRQASVAGQPKDHEEWWGRVDHESIRLKFMVSLNRFDLTNVTVMQMTSDHARNQFSGEIDILHLDGNHGMQAVGDAKSWCSLIRPGGIWIADDIAAKDWNVPESLEILKSNGFIELYQSITPEASWAVYQKL